METMFIILFGCWLHFALCHRGRGAAHPPENGVWGTVGDKHARVWKGRGVCMHNHGSQERFSLSSHSTWRLTKMIPFNRNHHPSLGQVFILNKWPDANLFISMYPSIYPSVHSSIWLPVCPSTCLSIYPSTCSIPQPASAQRSQYLISMPFLLCVLLGSPTKGTFCSAQDSQCVSMING